MAETSGNAAISPADTPGGHAACDAEMARLREHVARLGREHHRHALAVTAHKARADQQESRAAAAERQLARFARYAEEYDQLAEQAALGQRDSDVLKEIRRRIPPLERQADRCKAAETQLDEIDRVISGFFVVHGNNTSASLTAARDLAEAIRQVRTRVPLETRKRSDGKESP